MASTVAFLNLLAAEAGGEHESTSPYVYGGVALVVLLLLLFLTTRLHVDK